MLTKINSLSDSLGVSHQGMEHVEIDEGYDLEDSIDEEIVEDAIKRNRRSRFIAMNILMNLSLLR